MQNNFTYENTKDATHYAVNNSGKVNFYKLYDESSFVMNSSTNFEWEKLNPTFKLTSLTDQADRGYPTLEWFLGCGFKLEVGDEWTDTNKVKQVVANPHVINLQCKADINRHVKSLHDNRHDLTAMARDEYYAKKAERGIELGKSLDFKASPESRPNLTETPEETEVFDAIEKKQWPNNERIDAIGQNGNNGEHYPHESESPLSPNFESNPVYTQEMHDRGELPPVGSECLAMFSLDNMPAYWLKVRVLMFNKINAAACYLVDNELLDGKNLLWSCDFKPVDSRTDEEKLRDFVLCEMGCANADGDSQWSKIAHRLMNNDKFTITLNEED